MPALVALVLIFVSIFAFLIGLALVSEWFGNSDDRQKRKAEVLREKRAAKQEELDTLRSEHAKMTELLGRLQGEAQIEIIVSDNHNIFAHRVLDTIRKEK